MLTFGLHGQAGAVHPAIDLNRDETPYEALLHSKQPLARDK
jgi:hypothetical protein